MTSTAVKYITHAMRGAPIVNNVSGSLIAALRSVLSTGWGATPVLSVVVSGGVATLSVAPGSSFALHSVVLLEGVSSALDGQHRVLSTSNDAITFATSAMDGVLSAGGSVKFASAGWEEVFADAGKAVFRSADPLGGRFYLRVQEDADGRWARVVGYESMTDVDTGERPFPTSAQMSGGGYWLKGVYASAGSHSYVIAADSRSVSLQIALGRYYGDSYTTGTIWGFGDPIARAAAGDVWGAYLSAASDASAGGIDRGALSGGTSQSSFDGGGFVVAPRPLGGDVSPVLLHAKPFSGSAEISGHSSWMGAAASAVDAEIKTSRLFLLDQAANMARSTVPGVLYIPQSGARALLPAYTLHDGAGEHAGRKLMSVHVATNWNSSYGVALIDVTGPWRPQ